MKRILWLVLLAAMICGAALAEPEPMKSAVSDSIGRQIDLWIYRQRSSVADWWRRMWGIDDPYAIEDETPPPNPAPGQDGTGSQAFLWKPDSENDGKAATLFPAKYIVAEIERVYIEGGERDGERSRNPYWPQGRNGNRTHARWGRKGKDYGRGFYVVLQPKTGEPVRWKIKDGAKRQ